MLLERAAGKTLNPYQGLKLGRYAGGAFHSRRKNPKSLSGIETGWGAPARKYSAPEKP